MKTIGLISSVLALTVLSPTPASAGKLGEHPAIIAARVYATQGYDYASKFYPHPAKLYLLLQAPATDTPTEGAATGQAAAMAPTVASDKTLTALCGPNQSTR